MNNETISFPKTDAVIHRLENGLEIIVKETPGTELVSVQGWVRTGSLYEASMLGSGVSHLVEHLVFKGTGSRGPTELAQAVQGSGGYLNAYTSFDRTVYWVDTLQTGFDTALDVVASLISEATFPEDEYEREKDVIRREMDMGKDDPGRSLGELLFSTVFREHPYREPIIGRRDLFNQVTRDQAFGYYQERYTPEKTFMVIAGDINTDVVLEAVAARLGTKTNRMMASVILPAEPTQMGRRELHLDFVTELTRMELAWRIPDLLHRDTPALEVLGVLLGQGRSSRLHQELRERRGLVHEIGAGAYTPTQGGLFYVGAQLDPQNRVAATEAVMEQLDKLQQGGVSESEVAKARRIFLADQLSSLTTTRGLASDLGSSWMTTGNLDFTKDYLTAVDHVTAEQVQAVAQKYLIEKHLTVVSLNPKGTAQTTTRVSSSNKAKEIQKHVFANGLTLLVKEDDRLPMVHLQAALRGGVLEETPATNGLGRLMARTLTKGAGGHSAEEMASLIEARGGSLSADSGANSFSCYAGVLTPDLSLGLELWSDCLLLPHFSDSEVVREKERQLAAIKSEEDHLTLVAYRELRRHLYGEHPYHMSRNGVAESVASLTADQLRGFHREQVVAGNAVLAVFGDVRFADIVERVGGRLGAFPLGPRRDPKDLAILPDPSGKFSEITKEKKQAVLAIAYPTVDMAHPDRTALDLIDETCSDMASRMFVRIREELGLAYSVGASQMLGMVRGALVFHLSTAPEQLEFAQEELLKEISKLMEHGLEPAELDRARMSLTGKHAMQAQSLNGLAEVVVLDELYGFGYDHRKEALARIKSISVDEVNAVIKRYLSVSPIIARVRGNA
jgi:zinc protease